MISFNISNIKCSNSKEYHWYKPCAMSFTHSLNQPKGLCSLESSCSLSIIDVLDFLDVDMPVRDILDYLVHQGACINNISQYFVLDSLNYVEF